VFQSIRVQFLCSCPYACRSRRVRDQNNLTAGAPGRGDHHHRANSKDFHQQNQSTPNQLVEFRVEASRRVPINTGSISLLMSVCLQKSSSPRSEQPDSRQNKSFGLILNQLHVVRGHVRICNNELVSHAEFDVGFDPNPASNHSPSLQWNKHQ
jgi:hypothetical protein